MKKEDWYSIPCDYCNKKDVALYECEDMWRYWFYRQVCIDCIKILMNKQETLLED